MVHRIVLAAPDPDYFFTHFIDGGAVAAEGPAATWAAWWRARESLDEATRCAAGQGFVLTPGDLATLGVTRSAARHAVRRGRWTDPGRGAFAPLDVGADPGDGDPVHVITRRRHALVVAATASRRKTHVASGRSAAILWGLPTVNVPVQPEFTDPAAGAPGRRERTHVYPAGLRGAAIAEWHGVAVTTVARTLVDLGRHDADDAIMAADAVLREALVTRAEIDRELARATGWPGVRRAREVLRLADPGAESPIESLTRLRLHDDGFPTPRAQVEIAGYRVDLLLDAYRLVIEADGRVKYTADERWQEKLREHAIRSSSRLHVERVIWSDLFGAAWARTSRRLASYAPPTPASRRQWPRSGPVS